MNLTINSTQTLTSTTELRGVPLKAGQVLSAIVLQADQRSGQALLSLAGGQVRVQTQHPLITGSAIRLTVQTPGPPLVLTLQPATAAPSGAAMPAQSTALLGRLLGTLAQHLSQSAHAPSNSPLPNRPSGTAAPLAMRQHPVTSALTTPSATPVSSTTSTTLPPRPLLVTALPTGLQRALLAISAPHEPNANPIDPAKLAESLGTLVQHNSLPALPATPSGMNPAPTLHQALLQAAQQLRQSVPAGTATDGTAAPVTAPANAPNNASNSAPGAIQAAVGQWLNQLETSQLRSAIQQLSGQPAWLLDMPINWQNEAQRLRLSIQPDSSHTPTQTEPAPWQLEFALELPQLGTLHGSLRLEDSAISVRLYAEYPTAQTLLQNELARLDAQLRAADFTPQQLAVYAGSPPASARNRLTPPLAPEQALLAIKV